VTHVQETWTRNAVTSFLNVCHPYMKPSSVATKFNQYVTMQHDTMI